MDRLSAWKEKIAQLDAVLRPIAQRPVTFFALLMNSRHRIHPLDEAGVRAPVEQLLFDLIEYYPNADADTRRHIRTLFEEHRSFSWAATLPYEPVTDESFRSQIILFSIKDQEQDARDAMVLLESLSEKARSAGVKTGPILTKIAELSSEVDKYGMGSTRSLLRNAVPRPSS